MPVPPGSAAGATPLLHLEGEEATLAQLAGGRPVLLFFYKGECAASEVAARVLPRFAPAAGGLAVIAVSQDAPEATRAFADAHGWVGVQVVRDREPWPASEALGVRATPTWFLLDGSATVLRVEEGWSRDGANDLAREAARVAGSSAAVVAPDDGTLPAFRPG